MNNLDISNERKRESLRDSLCDYLDEGEIAQLAKDVKRILNDEKEKFEKMAGHYRKVLNYLSDKSMGDFWENK